ncbi:winged helix DNA-binding domain-containing protein [Acinetobacter sp. C26M]|uniref:winged helix-turn-helix domain-containing protein n=1 Tax=unclassified Acinetobacter TaxID=196816 RepID=UPI0020369CB9|nr:MULTISPECIES: crosslink repair DNA glycosylase YcaQ family protein [unclassified Acinetobacter]USA45348.1 winged helix DNA-binding domain-containing protein [Acinetobacter sp. C26M]USA48850.1 winged helix DNA-binding domain-containing protein [Acinetobacter sp. C26G]
MISLLKRLALSQQGLEKNNSFGGGISGTQKAIEHLGYVQIDTISVVERAHHHVLWSRVPDYQLSHLNQLVKEKQIFEHWAHAASYLPMQDYRYAMPLMNAIRNGESRYFRGDQKLMDEILVQVKAEGSIRLRHMEKGKREGSAGWWNAGPSRKALEQLFMQGDLMICERNGMEKVYDLTERCIPQGIDLSTPTLQEYAQYLLKTTIRAHGVFTWKQLLHLKTNKDLREIMRKLLDEQIDAGVLQVFKLENGQTVYVASAVLEDEPAIAAEVKILSPFDNLVIHRERLSSLFGFDYRIECYVPAAKRQYGYFCLPLLYADRLVGRIDCKVHRSEKRLEVISLHLEDPNMQDRDEFLQALELELHRFAQFNQSTVLDWDRNKLG